MKRFQRLSRLRDYTVDKHQPDPRGWDVIGTDQRTLGRVDDLLVDTTTMKAVYLDVELETKSFHAPRDPQLLIPVHRVERDTQHKRLLARGLDVARVEEMLDQRDLSYLEVWDRLWQRQVAADELCHALDTVAPGEQVRIPMMNDEIIVERRPLHQEDSVTTRVVEQR
jgi:hypothetical protein